MRGQQKGQRKGVSSASTPQTAGAVSPRLAQKRYAALTTLA